MTAAQLNPCPCGRRVPVGQAVARTAAPALAYSACCGRYIEAFNDTPAPDAEALMRSRYTAFVRANADYLRATWHASKRPSQISFDAGVRWLGLEVRDHQLLDADHAEVEFVARQRDRSGRAVRLHERSRFVREPDGKVLRWYYLDGDWQ